MCADRMNFFCFCTLISSIVSMLSMRYKQCMGIGEIRANVVYTSRLYSAKKHDAKEGHDDHFPELQREGVDARM